MREYVLTLLVTAAVTYMLTPLVRWVAIKFGAVIPARDRDVHAAPIPRMGGLAMYLGVAAGLLAAHEMVPLRDAFPGSGPIFGLLGAGGLIVAIGIIDDRWGMSAIGKLIGQVVAAVILFASGAQLSTFPGPNKEVFILTRNESIVLTILVVVATINAVNFIDGLDGLAGGIVFISAISFFAYYYSLVKVAQLPAMASPALAAIVLAGSCLGFLPHNFFPSRIFMGDTGSMLLGLLLAYVPIQAISQLDWASLNNEANRYAEILPLLLPAAVLVIPYFDMLRAVVRRTRAGLSPLAADRKHLHHRLLEIGHSHRASVLILYAWAALFSAAVVALSLVTVPLAVLLLTTLAAILLLALLSMPKLRWWERAKEVARRPAPDLARQPAPELAPVLAAPDPDLPVSPAPVSPAPAPAARPDPQRGDMLFRPIEPTPVHPIDATMPMPAAKTPAASTPGASTPGASTPAARASGRVVP
ncbi:MAG TPA: undecaprenyl/decaprenyl-phosphate alpha-N-acetylglucosaminyl 1-phosphate transferase [Streptosporangiaceae bacterium]